MKVEERVGEEETEGPEEYANRATLYNCISTAENDKLVETPVVSRKGQRLIDGYSNR